jgi:hypothetical protein
VLAVANPKGGSGTATLVANLAVCLARRGRHVAIAQAGGHPGFGAEELVPEGGVGAGGIRIIRSAVWGPDDPAVRAVTTDVVLLDVAAWSLLVWDNVDDLAEVLPLLNVLSGRHHLVTSRRSGGWHRIGMARPLRLGGMEPGDAVALLTGLAGDGAADGVAAEQLCAELGFLPLAVEQAGAYMAEAGISVRVYLERWRMVCWIPRRRPPAAPFYRKPWTP